MEVISCKYWVLLRQRETIINIIDNYSVSSRPYWFFHIPNHFIIFKLNVHIARYLDLFLSYQRPFYSHRSTYVNLELDRTQCHEHDSRINVCSDRGCWKYSFIWHDRYWLNLIYKIDSQLFNEKKNEKLGTNI